jgi:hypothetical protein
MPNVENARRGEANVGPDRKSAGMTDATSGERPWPPARVAIWSIIAAAALWWNWGKWVEAMRPQSKPAQVGELMFGRDQSALAPIGRLEAVDAARSTVTINQDNVESTLPVAADAHLMVNGRWVKLGEIVPGAPTWVEHSPDQARIVAIVQAFEARQFFDFSQEWLSGRNFRAGRPVYSPQGEALFTHTGYRSERDRGEAGWMVPWNAHPPVSILIALPFTRLPYEDAHFAWNLAMLGAFLAALVLALRFRRAPFHVFDCLWLLAMLVCCFPLLTQAVQGQLNGILVLLAVLAWAADRCELDGMAGALIGAAAAVKIIPAFLLIYWLARSKWRALAGALACFAFLNVAAGLLFGMDCFVAYIGTVIPSVSEYRSSWDNISLSGLWYKLFNSLERAVQSWVQAPALAQGLSLACQALVTVLVARRCRQAATRDQRDHALGLAVIGLFLVSPITWQHYLVMLLLPLAVATASPRHWAALLAYRACFVILWLPLAFFGALTMGPSVLTEFSAGRHLLPPSQPWQVLAGLAIPTYALVLLFCLYYQSFPAPAEPADAGSLKTAAT